MDYWPETVTCFNDWKFVMVSNQREARDESDEVVNLAIGSEKCEKW